MPQGGPRGRGRRPAVGLRLAQEGDRLAPGTRPTPRDLAAAVARGAAVPDVVRPGLAVLFCGINPGRWSGAVGHHFAHPGNRFWKALELAGLTTRLLTPYEDDELLHAGLGVTNLVARTTATAAELGSDELREGARRLEEKVRSLRPGAVAFLGVGAYRSAFGRRNAALGMQPETLAGATVWVLANPSGLQARYGLDALAAQLRAVRDAVAT